MNIFKFFTFYFQISQFVRLKTKVFGLNKENKHDVNEINQLMK